MQRYCVGREHPGATAPALKKPDYTATPAKAGYMPWCSGRLSGFSVDHLLAIVHRLGHNVELRISKEEDPPEQARMLVCVV
ncbi:MAG TPA: hypothetical protein VEZ12_19240 [Herpetosiphonaceae bacterium]|nr:hypothetical protein [Herpetosiphonaceae bacterium]